MSNSTNAAITPGLHVYQACTLGPLADRLVQRWSVPLADPFTADLAVVPSEGARQWLSQRIAASAAEICAGVDFVTFGALEHLLLDDDPAWWQPGRAAWLLHRIVVADASAVLDPLRAQLDATGEPYLPLRTVVARFARYAAYRPGMVAGWRDGRPDDGWQLHLWRALRAETGGDPVDALNSLVSKLTDGPDDLPPRIAVIADVIPAHRWTWLRALASRHQVDVYQVIGGAGDDHPFGRALGRQSAEAARVTPVAAQRLPDAPTPDTLLGWLQADIRAGVRPAARVLRPGDRSVQVHLSHGLSRQVEVLRDTLAWLLQFDETLEPRDIAVLTPDVDAVAPLIAGAFQQATGAHPADEFRVRVAGRTGAHVNPCVPLVLRLANLHDTRMSASEMLDLLAAEPIARRFGFAGQAHERLAELVERARIRWGLNGAHRASFGLDGFPQSTWVDGLQRLLLGIALPGDDLTYVKATLPTDDVDSSDVPLLGGLAEFISRLGRILQECDTPATIPEWTGRFRRIVEWLLDFGAESAWQATDFFAGLARIDEQWEPGCPAVGRASAVRVVRDEFEGRSTRRGFGDGSLVVCGIDALRHVPHRVVCLLGWDEQVYPRRPSRDGDDLLRVHPEPGDPSAAASDRQALLDAINMTGETLVVVARGRSELTNRPTPLAGPVHALLAAIDATAQAADGRAASQAVTVAHPLQASSPRCFDGAIPRSFDAAGYRTALLARDRRAQPAPEPPDPADLVLPALDPGAPVTLDELLAFFKNPARALLRTRMGLSWAAADADADSLPVELDSLQRWALGDRLLRQALAGLPPDRVIDAERRRGDIPPGQLGGRILDDVSASVSGVLGRLDRVPAGAAAVHEVALDVGDVRVAGVVNVRGQAIVDAEFSRAQPRQRLSAWVRLVALAAAVPGDWRAYIVTPGATRALRAPSAADAARVLGTLVAIYRYGLTRPIPAPPRVNEAWTVLRHQRRDPLEPGAFADLERAWKFDRDDAWATFYPDELTPLIERPADPGLAVGPADETTLQGRLARAIWDDIADHEVEP